VAGQQWCQRKAKRSLGEEGKRNGARLRGGGGLELILTRLPIVCTCAVARQCRDRAAAVTDVRGRRATMISLEVAAHSSTRWVRRPGGKRQGSSDGLPR
jgi:hypothetical protein